jgi:hypothetical protein
MMGKTLNELRDEAFAYAKKQGFHEKPVNFGEMLMLAVSELSEALEADREGKWDKNHLGPLRPCGKCGSADIEPNGYALFATKYHIRCRSCGYDVSGDTSEEASENWNIHNFAKDSVECELADAILRICGIAGVYGIDLEWHVAAKMAYNETRPYLHGKKYG